jgi:hypothetical protein
LRRLQNFQRNSKEKILPLESGIYQVEELYNLIIDHASIRWQIKPKTARDIPELETLQQKDVDLAMGMRTACLVL